MATNSSIEWTEATWNPTAGCSIVSPGCQNCYAMRAAYRLEMMGQEKYSGTTKVQGGRHVWNGTLNTDAASLDIPLKWKKPKRIFVNSMSDLFHAAVPDEFIDKVFAVMALCPQHTFQVLTKRPERMQKYVASRGSVMNMHWLVGPGISTHDEVEAWCKKNGVTRKERERRRSIASYYPGKEHSGKGECNRPPWPLPNVWLGTSVEDQTRADERIPWLLKTPAAVRFLSCEPLLSDVILHKYLAQCRCGHGHGFTACPNTGGVAKTCHRCDCRQLQPLLNWVIVGGESGPRARQFDVGWARSIITQCNGVGVACFVKQLGDKPVYRSKPPFDGPQQMMYNGERLSKKGGDPAEWMHDLRVREFPEVAHA